MAFSYAFLPRYLSHMLSSLALPVLTRLVLPRPPPDRTAQRNANNNHNETSSRRPSLFETRHIPRNSNSGKAMSQLELCMVLAAGVCKRWMRLT